MNKVNKEQGIKIVNSHNEWDTLEEVIVGRLEHAMFPSWNTINAATIPPIAQESIKKLYERAGKPYPIEVIKAAQQELETFVNILNSEGIIVRRPDVFDFSLPFSTPKWRVQNGFCSANPRDIFLVVGDEIIETPTADRGRYFETWAYRSLLKYYFLNGAKWTSAPKPQLLDNLYDFKYEEPPEQDEMRYIITEFEPTFDAADFLRCGKEIFVQKSHVTNEFGIKWLQRHLGTEYTIHIIETNCRQPLHIDTTIAFLGKGKLLINPEFIDKRKLPDIFSNWDVFEAPKPISFYTKSSKIKVVSDWMSLNVLMLDENRVVVEKNQEPMIRFLKNIGLKPIVCPFENYYPFGGSFPCATLDIRRRSKLESYF